MPFRLLPVLVLLLPAAGCTLGPERGMRGIAARAPSLHRLECEMGP